MTACLGELLQLRILRFGFLQIGISGSAAFQRVRKSWCTLRFGGVACHRGLWIGGGKMAARKRPISLGVSARPLQHSGENLGQG
jgi:hypothetical protein